MLSHPFEIICIFLTHSLVITSEICTGWNRYILYIHLHSQVIVVLLFLRLSLNISIGFVYIGSIPTQVHLTSDSDESQCVSLRCVLGQSTIDAVCYESWTCWLDHGQFLVRF